MKTRCSGNLKIYSILHHVSKKKKGKRCISQIQSFLTTLNILKAMTADYFIVTSHMQALHCWFYTREVHWWNAIWTWLIHGYRQRDVSGAASLDATPDTCSLTSRTHHEHKAMNSEQREKRNVYDRPLFDCVLHFVVGCSCRPICLILEKKNHG